MGVREIVLAVVGEVVRNDGEERAGAGGGRGSEFCE